MATIKMTTGELQTLVELFVQNWASEKDRIRLGPKALYSLIGLKKKIEDHARTMQETIAMMAEQAGGTPNEMGGYQIPPENREELNKKLNDLSKEEVELEYTPIDVAPNDIIPVGLMDTLFNFINLLD